MATTEKRCWDCTCRPVCKYWAAIAENRFPFASDDKIPAFTNNIAYVLATACAWYRPQEEVQPPKS